MTDLVALKARNAARWQAMHINGQRLAEFKATADRLCDPASKARFQGVTDRLAEFAALSPRVQPVPWWFTAIVAEREYGGPPHWDKQLGQGDDLASKSHNVPAGMGPYLVHPGDSTPGHDAWTRCCVDVLINSAPFAARNDDWSIGGTLTLWEEYNGLGYAARGIASPYVWSGSDQYDVGKFVADHVFDPKRRDVQLGCAPLLAMMMTVDPSIGAAA